MKTVKSLLYASVFLTSITPITAIAQVKSAYTSIDNNDKQCKLVDSAGGSYEIRNCPSFAGYRVERVDGKNGSGLNIGYGTKLVAYFDNEPAGLINGNTAEWRYQQSGNGQNYHALIFRTSKTPRLVVIRLDKENSCILGVIPQSNDMNDKARKLADNLSARCNR